MDDLDMFKYEAILYLKIFKVVHEDTEIFKYLY